MYDVKIYVKDNAHYVQLDEEGLTQLRGGLEDDTAPKFIEVVCRNEGSIFAIKSDSVVAYSYKEANE